MKVMQNSINGNKAQIINSLIIGDFCAGIPVGEHTPLEQRETSLEGEDKEEFLRLVRKMLQWEPEKRKSAKELEEDAWLQNELHK